MATPSKFIEQARHEEVVSALRQALDSSSLSEEEYINLLYLVGQCLESLGRPAEAIESYTGSGGKTQDSWLSRAHDHHQARSCRRLKACFSLHQENCP